MFWLITLSGSLEIILKSFQELTSLLSYLSFVFPENLKWFFIAQSQGGLYPSIQGPSQLTLSLSPSSSFSALINSKQMDESQES